MEEKVERLVSMSQQFAYTSIQMHEAIGRKAGMAGTDHKYLGFFLQRGEMTAGELAVFTGLTTGAVTNLIDRLEEKQLIRRSTDSRDRRKIILVPDIRKITALLLPLYEDFKTGTQELLSSFSQDELAVLAKYFTGAMELMNKKLAAINQKK
ncbi:MarR family transcriptional regulator [Pedobacter insulae]|uniref:DNA-binding transcriptional regulator, MarR family n=1 Tax=Pedobacter insulae TaxID=414048 RepID=A0A1I2WEK3_9SPHI|nr:MarR family transcriptional regulator [Pedobacter insulae]SFG99718.1 DNA-binding transcriptional regulator, MarR family [Pedobacter insulae]